MRNKETKITIIMTHLSGGGAERVMLLLAKGLANKGFKIDFIVGNTSNYKAEKWPDNIHLIDLNVSRFIYALPKLVRLFRGYNTDYVLSALKLVNVLTICAAKIALLEAEIVISEHSTISEKILNAENIKGKYIIPFLMKVTYPWATKIVSVSKGVADDLAQTIRINRQNIDVIYNPVIEDQMFDMANEPISHRWFEGDIPVIMGIGRLIKVKNFSLLIKAFTKVRKNRKCKLIILGEGEKRPQLKKLVKNLNMESEVALPGFYDNPYAYLSRADLFVLSSNVEGLPTVLIEALAFEIPVVSTDCPSGPEEILENGKWGTIVPRNNVEAMAKAMDKGLNSKPTNSKERAMHFTVERAVQKYSKLISKLYK